MAVQRVIRWYSLTVSAEVGGEMVSAILAVDPEVYRNPDLRAYAERELLLRLGAEIVKVIGPEILAEARFDPRP